MDFGPLAPTSIARLLGVTGFVHLKGIVSDVTGETIPVDIEIHADDLDWCLDLWQQAFAMDYILGLPQSYFPPPAPKGGD